MSPAIMHILVRRFGVNPKDLRHGLKQDSQKWISGQPPKAAKNLFLLFKVIFNLIFKFLLFLKNYGANLIELLNASYFFSGIEIIPSRQVPNLSCRLCKRSLREARATAKVVALLFYFNSIGHFKFVFRWHIIFVNLNSCFFNFQRSASAYHLFFYRYAVPIPGPHSSKRFNNYTRFA